MRYKNKGTDFSPSALDFSQEAPLFRQRLREQFLAAAGGSVTLLEDDALDGLNAAGVFDHAPPRKPERQD